MKKLQNKTFALICSILTLFLFTVLIIFNVSAYHDEYKQTVDKINRVASFYEKFNLNLFEFKNPLFMDSEVYVVSFDQRGNVKKITNYSNDGLSNEEIIKLISNNYKKYELGKVGNLIFTKYIFSINRSGDLIIVNNTSVSNYLKSNIYKSISIFIVLELVILYVTYILTKWIVKPVEETFNKQKQFIYDASHELKTPISIIMASAESIDEKAKNKKMLDNIKEESERMNKLVVDLLELSKSEDISDNIIFSEVNLSKIIENRSLSFESIMFEANLTLELDIDKDIIFKCDEEKIKELLSILLDNAIKHGYTDSVVKVSLKTIKDIIVLSVTNRGDAIPESEQNKIFERFYRVDKARNRNENRYGLGLAIAKNIVNNHKGNISVNCIDGYKTFKVEFKIN